MTELRVPNRWLMLGVSMLGQIAGTIFVNGAPFLIPYLHLERGLSLVEAGTIAAAPLTGTMFTLVALGHDRRPHRRASVHDGRTGHRHDRRAGREPERLAARSRPVVPRRRHRRRQHQLGERPRRRRLVPGTSPRHRDGHPADRAAARRRPRGAARAQRRQGVRPGHDPAPHHRHHRGRDAPLRGVDRRPAAAHPQRGGGPRAPRQPLHPRLPPVAHPPRLGLARRPAVHGVDLHAGVADRRQGLVDVRRQRPGRVDAAARCGRPDRRGLVVRPGRQPARPHAHGRDRGHGDDALAGPALRARPWRSR